MKNKQLLTYGLIALGIFILTRKKEEPKGEEAGDTVLPGTPVTPPKVTDPRGEVATGDGGGTVQVNTGSPLSI